MCEFDTTCEMVGFEGPEKRLEIDFKPNSNRPAGLRCFNREQIQELLDLARCSIVSSKSNEYFDSYVLSESSLFIYPYKLMIKTCGTTTLLNCITKLLEFASFIDLEVEFVKYSRKNFLFPTRQMFPHLNWGDEVSYLNKIFDGTAYVLGPHTQSHWFLYLADYSDHRGSRDDQEMVMELMMHDLDRAAANKFYRRDGIADDEKFPGIANLLPGSETNEFNFSPCGYSMNGLFREAYYTIHVTPEPHCSYASFETNVTPASCVKLISSVCEIFKPGSFTVTFFKENGIKDYRCHQESIDLNIPGFNSKHKTHCELEGCCEVTLYNFKGTSFATTGKKKLAPKYPIQPSNHNQS